MAQRIVNYMLYDTDRATYVANIGAVYLGSEITDTEDSSYWHGALYVTEKKNWFVVVERGKTIDVEGHKLVPLSTGDAMRMLEKNKLWDIILEHFDVEEA
jgi:hypothetical protein